MVNMPAWLARLPVRGARGTAQQGLAVGAGAGAYGAMSQPLPQYGGNSPLFGRPGWTYINVVDGPRQGPTPRLAQGTGRTGSPDLRNMGALPNGYLSANDYRPDPYDYSPPTQPAFTKHLPRSIGVGDDGFHALGGTYKAHDYTIGTYTQNHYRSSANWQQMAFPPTNRQLASYQQVAKYNLYNQVASARPLSQNNYFLGYAIDPTQAGAYGGSGMGRPLGS